MQICKILGANPIAVVSSPDKYDMVKSLGATGVINRKDFAFAWQPE